MKDELGEILAHVRQSVEAVQRGLDTADDTALGDIRDLLDKIADHAARAERYLREAEECRGTYARTAWLAAAAALRTVEASKP